MNTTASPTLSAGIEGTYRSRDWPSGQERPTKPGLVRRAMVGMTIELGLVLIYLVAMGVADLQASKLGLMVGPIPVFLTDITLFLLFVTSFVRWPSRILYWLSEGFGAGSVGRAV